MKTILLMICFVGCGVPCDFSVDNVCVVSRFESGTLQEADIHTAYLAVSTRFPELNGFVDSKGLELYFEPYRNDGLYGWFLCGNEVYVRFVDVCVSSETLIHELLHLVEKLDGKGCGKEQHDQTLFYSKGALEFTLHREFFPGCY